MLAAIVLAVALSSSTQLPAPVGHGRAEVETVLTAALPTLQQCNSERLAGNVTFDVSITEDGTVHNVVRALHVDDTPAVSAIAPCLLERLRALTFLPKPAAHLWVRLEFAPVVRVRDLVVLTPSAVPDVQLASPVSSSVAAAVGPQIAALVDCYRTALQASPTVAGSLIVRHVVAADGTIIDDAIEHRQQPDEILHVPLKACVRGVLREVRYPASTSTEALVPLRFVRPASPDVSALHRALTAQAAALGKCSRQKGGPMSIAFTIDRNGAASDASAAADLDAACVRGVVEAAQWPAPEHGTVRVSAKVEAEGGLSREEIQRVVSASLARIKSCYDRALNKHPTLQGTITVLYVIGPAGTVLNVRTARASKAGQVELTDPQVVTCVVEVIRGHQYPRPGGGGLVNVTYPFVFSPG